MLPNGDRVVAITDSQLAIINVLRVDFKRYKALSDSLSSLVSDCHIEVVNLQELITVLKGEKAQLSGMSADDAKIYAVQAKEINTLSRQLRWAKFRSKVFGGTFGTTTAVAVIALIVVLSKR